MTRPTLTIIAGSNGCGKTTLTTKARDKFQQFPVLDPDAIALSLQQTSNELTSDIAAGKDVLAQAEELLRKRQSFTVETTLYGATYLKMAVRAKTAGFNVVAFLVGTSSVEINIERVKRRVESGGHDVPEEDQRRRYPRTLGNMPKLMRMADAVVIFDNSTEGGHSLIGLGRPGSVHWFEPVPEWAATLHELV